MSTSVTTRPPGRSVQSGTAEPAIRLRGLRKCFRGHLGIGKTVALDDLSLDVERGQIFGLLGPNGAGKTTTIKLLLGLLRPDAGQLQLLGRPVTDVSVRRRLGFLPENPYFYDHLSGEEFLDFCARLHGMDASSRRERIARTLQQVGLAGRERTRMRKMSKGMTQRLGLAQAILHDPELVILDEPMSGLDPIGRRDVRDLILGLRARGRTVVFSSHILQDAEMICDRVAILNGGRLQSVGSLEDLVSRRVEWFEVTVRGTLPDGLPAEVVSREGKHVLLRVRAAADLGPLLSRLQQSGAEVSSVWPRRQTLEDHFLAQVRR